MHKTQQQTTRKNRPSTPTVLILGWFAMILKCSAFAPSGPRPLHQSGTTGTTASNKNKNKNNNNKSPNTMLFFEAGTNSTGTLWNSIPSTTTRSKSVSISKSKSKRSGGSGSGSPTELSVASTASVAHHRPATTTTTTADSHNRNHNHNGNHNHNHNHNRPSSYKIYCDMDGCLVNFEKGVRRILHTASSDLDRRRMWEGIASAPLWFETLEWQMDGRRLWSAIKHLRPDILTGVPGDVRSSRVEKFNWCKRELGLDEALAHHVDMAAEGTNGGDGDDHSSVNGNLPREDKTNIITCWSDNKHKECNRQGSILIDDRIDLKHNWESAGGIFIHHINTETTIRKLRDLGVISEEGLDNGENEWYWEGSWRLWKEDE